MKRATREMTLEELHGVMLSIKRSCRGLEKSVSEFENAMGSKESQTRVNRNRVSLLINAGMYNNGETVEILAGELAEFMKIIDGKLERSFDEHGNYAVFLEKVKKKQQIATHLLKLLEENQETTQNIEGIMGRYYGGEYRWRAILGLKITTQVNHYFRNPGVDLARMQAIRLLKNVKYEIETESGQKTFLNPEEITKAQEDTKLKIAFLLMLGRDVDDLQERVKKAAQTLRRITN